MNYNPARRKTVVIFELEHLSCCERAALFKEYDLNPVKGTGRYNNTINQSFMIKEEDLHIDFVKELAKAGEESILIVEGDTRKASLYYVGNSYRDRYTLGTLVAVPEAVALNQNAWSHFNNTFYICK